MMVLVQDGSEACVVVHVAPLDPQLGQGVPEHEPVQQFHCHVAGAETSVHHIIAELSVPIAIAIVIAIVIVIVAVSTPIPTIAIVIDIDVVMVIDVVIVIVKSISLFNISTLSTTICSAGALVVDSVDSAELLEDVAEVIEVELDEQPLLGEAADAQDGVQPEQVLHRWLVTYCLSLRSRQ